MPFACVRNTDGYFLRVVRDWIDYEASPEIGKVWEKEGPARLFAEKYNNLTARKKGWYAEGTPRYAKAVARGIAKVVEVRLQIVGATGPGAVGLGCILK